jgi:Zn-finger nucleic acid-binding protein
MDCPICKNAMITIELSEVEIDYCTDCGGIWLDSGELEMLLGEPEKAKQLLDSFKPDSKSIERPIKCPICDKKMQKIIVGFTKPTLLIDKCRRGDGLWFDRAELQNIVNRADLDKDNKIRELLADMFGHSQQD